MTVDDLLEDIITREGGYVNHPDDKGGPTRWGINIYTLRNIRHPQPVTASDVAALTKDEAKQIYRQVYLEGPGYAEAISDERLLALVFDYAVHSGPGRATKALQRAIGVTDDGFFGPSTKHFLGLSDPRDVFKRLLAGRMGYLVRLVLDDPSQRVFVDGWLNRVIDFL